MRDKTKKKKKKKKNEQKKKNGCHSAVLVTGAPAMFGALLRSTLQAEEELTIRMSVFKSSRWSLDARVGVGGAAQASLPLAQHPPCAAPADTAEGRVRLNPFWGTGCGAIADVAALGFVAAGVTPPMPSVPARRRQGWYTPTEPQGGFLGYCPQECGKRADEANERRKPFALFLEI